MWKGIYLTPLESELEQTITTHFVHKKLKSTEFCIQKAEKYWKAEKAMNFAPKQGSAEVWTRVNRVASRTHYTTTLYTQMENRYFNKA